MALSPKNELQARRLIAQGLADSQARPELANPQAVAQHLLALQGQNYRAGIRALALRVNNGSAVSEDAVHEAVASQQIVRAWPLRGTLHFMNGADARWLMRLCSPRLEKAAAQRRPALGIEKGAFEAAASALQEHLLDLAPGDSLPRPDAYELMSTAGLDPASGRGPHLLRALGGWGDVVQHLPQGRHETFVHIDRLQVTQHELSGDVALAELGSRYIAGHGPVTVDDLAWWAYLTKRDVKKAYSLAKDTAQMTIGGVDYWVPTWQLDVSAAELEEALDRTYYLPAFDEYLLGYADKSFTMDPEIRHEVLTMNGISWDFTVAGGTVVGRTEK